MVCSLSLFGNQADISAVVVHLGTMIGGHYIAYCLVDPEKMFGDAPMPTDLEVDGRTENIEECRPEPVGEKKDRRVWCFCSEYVFSILEEIGADKVVHRLGWLLLMKSCRQGLICVS
jgi:hypothetical protein